MDGQDKMTGVPGGESTAVSIGPLGWCTRLLWVVHGVSFWALFSVPTSLVIDVGLGLLVYIAIPLLLLAVSPLLSVASITLLWRGSIDLGEGIFGASTGILLMLANAVVIWGVLNA